MDIFNGHWPQRFFRGHFIVHLGAEALNPFKDLPAEGVLFPYLSSVRAGDRATEFKQRCRQLGIQGVTLHSYRYAWAERAKTVGYAIGTSVNRAAHRAEHLAVLARLDLDDADELGDALDEFDHGVELVRFAFGAALAHWSQQFAPGIIISGWQAGLREIS